MKYPAILEEFYAYLTTIQGKSERTAKAYLQDLMLFFRYVEAERKNVTINELPDTYIRKVVTLKWIKEIKIENIRRFMYYCQTARRNSPITRARKVASIKAFFSFLKMDGHIRQNIATEIETPKLSKTLPVYLNVDEAKRILKCNHDFKFPYRNRCILTFLLHLGLRVSELISLNIDSIDGDIVRIKGKGNKEREIVLNQECLTALNLYIKHERNFLAEKAEPGVKKALFLSREKKRLSVRMVQRIVKKATASSEIQFKTITPHKLRHTFATQLHNAGISIRTLQHILGHASIATTQIYTHVSNKEIRDAMIVSNHIYQ